MSLLEPLLLEDLLVFLLELLIDPGALGRLVAVLKGVLRGSLALLLVKLLRFLLLASSLVQFVL